MEGLELTVPLRWRVLAQRTVKPLNIVPLVELVPGPRESANALEADTFVQSNAGWIGKRNACVCVAEASRSKGGQQPAVERRGDSLTRELR